MQTQDNFIQGSHYPQVALSQTPALFHNIDRKTPSGADGKLIPGEGVSGRVGDQGLGLYLLGGQSHGFCHGMDNCL